MIAAADGHIPDCRECPRRGIVDLGAGKREGTCAEPSGDKHFSGREPCDRMILTKFEHAASRGPVVFLNEKRTDNEERSTQRNRPLNRIMATLVRGWEKANARFGQCNVLHSDMKRASKLMDPWVGTRAFSSSTQP